MIVILKVSCPMPVFLRYEIEKGLRAVYLPNQMIFGFIMFHWGKVIKQIFWEVEGSMFILWTRSRH